MGEVIEPLALILGPIWPYLDSIGTFLALGIYIATIESVLLYLDILHILQVVVIYHFFEFGYLFFGAAVILRLVYALVIV